MRLSFGNDDLGRLVCTFHDGTGVTTACAADGPIAIAALREALDALDRHGEAECFWLVSAGEYRWVFKRIGGKLRLAVLWCASVAIGFQHVAWAEDEFDSFTTMMRGELARYAVTVR
ncbi:hypothetical protein [uncultured Paludibaculum sp.]|uniref:hypothetical protein n=1 Tax=uncultured Paludibaculum sp. TaxID=1765020 RepID=UPI002AAACE8A|nr:hypothetical protein [uncultured Paludibaculum sp.]